MIKYFESFEILDGKTYFTERFSDMYYFIADCFHHHWLRLRTSFSSQFVAGYHGTYIMFGENPMHKCFPTAFLITTDSATVIHGSEDVYLGLPQLIIEAKCDTNSHVIDKKISLYKRYGIQEIWVIDTRTFKVQVLRRDTCESDYDLTSIITTSISNLSLDLSHIFDEKLVYPIPHRYERGGDNHYIL